METLAYYWMDLFFLGSLVKIFHAMFILEVGVYIYILNYKSYLFVHIAHTPCNLMSVRPEEPTHLTCTDHVTLTTPSRSSNNWLSVLYPSGCVSMDSTLKHGFP